MNGAIRISKPLLTSLLILLLFQVAFPANRQPVLSDEDVRVMEEQYRDIPVTQWVDYNGLKPITYDEWKAHAGEPTAFSAKQITISDNSRSGVKICVVVNSSLYSSIAVALNQYETDLVNEGHTVEIVTASGGTPEDFRAFLQGKYAEGMEGCLLIGDLPIPWYETVCWEEQTHAEFPCDLFYMDLDGTFTDSDSDGLYDGHSGDLYPEIWVGRLTPSPLNLNGQTEAQLLNNYFAKNHAYRTGSLTLPIRGLSYIEDDWAPFAISWDNDHGRTYDTRVLEYNEITTFDTDYEAHLPLGFESIFLCAHSNPTLHQFKSGSSYGYTFNSEIVSIDPHAFFYNLFCCSNARYVENNYMGGWYIFCQDYGLASIGSTKTGAMLSFSYFYEPFGNCATIGEAFRDWFSVIAYGGFTIDETCWHYGMTLCGDPTLRAKGRQPMAISAAPPLGRMSQEYQADVNISGGITPYSCQIGTGALPAGLTIDPATGQINGTPTEHGEFSFTVVVNDDCTYDDFSVEEPMSMTVYTPCGDLNEDVNVDILDIVVLINFVYKGGADPVPMVNAYIDEGGVIDILDIVRLINFVYKNGGSPLCQ